MNSKLILPSILKLSSVVLLCVLLLSTAGINKAAAGPPAQAGAIHMLPGTVSVSDGMQAATVAALSEAPDLFGDSVYFAITDVRQENDWALVSVLGLARAHAGSTWSINDSTWLGLLLFRRGTRGDWEGAVRGAVGFDQLLVEAPEAFLDETAKHNLGARGAPSAPASAPAAGSFVFPWQSNTSMFYGNGGVHDNGFSFGSHVGWKAVDMMSDGNTSAGHAPNRLLASEAGTIGYKCADSNNVAILLGDFFYTHLQDSASLLVGTSFSQGAELGTMKVGSFGTTGSGCGWASQPDGWFHVHWGFPNADLQVEDWTLSMSTQDWTNATTTVAPGGGWIKAHGIQGDDIDTPIDVAALPFSETRDTSLMSAASDDPTAATCGLTPSLVTAWYRYVPSDSSAVSVDTFGSSYDTNLAVWTGARGSLSAVACNDDAGNTLQSELRFNTNVGTTYYIEVAGHTGGTLQFHVSRIACTISGNAGVGGATLSWMDATPKTTAADGSGNYSLMVPSGWSGTVTPSRACYAFTLPSHSYSNILSDQGVQDFTAVPIANCAPIEVKVGGSTMGYYGVLPGEAARASYAGVDSGPVVVASTNGTHIIAAERDSWWDGKTWSDYAQVMGLPAGQVSDTYVFPAYNNVTLDEQLRFGNVDTVDTTVTVTIGGIFRGSYLLHPSQAVRVNYAGVDSGPVVVQGTPNVKIIAAERNSWWDGKTWSSYAQLMGLPASQVTDTYVFPAYNNVTLDEQLRFGNVDTVDTTVTVTIGGIFRGSYLLHPSQAVRVNYAGVDSGPVVVQGTPNVKIIAAERDSWWDGTTWSDYNQLMGLPAGQVSDTYVFPAYNNVTLDEQLRFGNVDTVDTTVTVTIGGVVRGSYLLHPGQAVRVNYAGVDSGPVVVQGTPGVKIIAAERDSWWDGAKWSSFVQLMGLPSSLLSNSYVFPAYNNVTLDEQLRFGVP